MRYTIRNKYLQIIKIIYPLNPIDFIFKSERYAWLVKKKQCLVNCILEEENVIILFMS